MNTESDIIDKQPELVHADSPSDTPGTALRKAREQLALSVSDVAVQLHLSRNVIEALENDEYQKLASISFARGYLRSYAKHLKLDPEDIINRFTKLNIVEPERAPIQKNIVKEVKAGDRSVKWISYFIALALGTLVIVWWHNHSNTQPRFKKAVTTATLATPTVDESTMVDTTSEPASTTATVDTAQTENTVSNDNQVTNAPNDTSANETNSNTVVQTTAKKQTADSTQATSAKVHQGTKHFSNWKNPDLN